MAASVAYQGMDDNNRMPPPNMDYQNTTYNLPGQSRVRQSALLDIVQAKKVFVYRNNQQHYAGHEVVVNPKSCPDMDHLMDLVTQKIGASTAVRYIFTPINGTRVNSLGDIKQNQRLVAASRNKFRRLDYSKAGPQFHQTTVLPRKQLQRRVTKPLPYIQARLYNQRAEAFSIWVYQSGYQGQFYEPKKIQLIPRIRHHWVQILDEITYRFKDTFGVAVLKLFTIDKTREITDPSELENGAKYIAVGPAGLKKDVQYDDLITPKPPLQYGHGVQKHSRDEKPTYAKMHNARVTADRSKAASRKHPDTNKSKYRQRPRQESETFPNKPVKHKRDVRAAGTSRQQPHAPLTEKDEKARGSVYRSGRVKPHDAAAHAPDADDRGVYKSKRGVVQAAEVQEDEDTHVDLPIDQIPAETVETEEILDVSAEQTDHEQIPRESRDSPVPTQRSIYEDVSNDIKDFQKSPSRTPTSPTRHRDDDFPQAHEPVAETTMKSNSMSNEAQQNVEPQKTFKSNSMAEQQAQYGQDDDDDKITFAKLDSVKDEEPVQQEKIPQDLPLLTEAGKDEVGTSQEVEPPKPEANDAALTDDEEAEKTITEEINESSKENVSSSIHDDQEGAQHTTEEELSDAKDYDTTKPGDDDKQASSLQAKEDNKLEDGQENERQPTPVGENERQPSPIGENERQPSPVVENEIQPNPVVENERQPSPVVENERRPSPALENEGEPGPVVETVRQTTPTGEVTDDLRRPDGAYDTSNDKREDGPLQENEIMEDTARPGTSTPVMANGNGAILASNENQKDLAQNETAVKEVNVSS